MKVFLVNRMYFPVEAVFSSKELAQKYMDKIQNADVFWCSTWELEEFEIDKGGA